MVEAKELFNRADLHQIMYFLVHGKEDENKKQAAYENRLHKVSTDILKEMQALKLEPDTYEEITNNIFKAFRVYEEVFTEIGLKMGARIFFQLICEDEKYTLKKQF